MRQVKNLNMKEIVQIKKRRDKAKAITEDLKIKQMQLLEDKVMQF